MRCCSGDMEAYQGVAVAAFVVEGEGGEVQRGTAVALGDHQPVGREDGGDGLPQRPAERLRVPVWRIQEDQIVLTGPLACGAQGPGDVAADHFDLVFEALEVRPDGPDGRRVVVDEGGGGGAAAERLDAQRAGPGEEVEDAGVVESRAEDGEQRLLDAVGRRAGGLTRRRDEAPALVRAGDDPHLTRGWARALRRRRRAP